MFETVRQLVHILYIGGAISLFGFFIYALFFLIAHAVNSNKTTTPEEYDFQRSKVSYKVLVKISRVATVVGGLLSFFFILLSMQS